MARYATGVHAKAICDKCGLSYPYISLRAEWNGLRSCPDCWDAKHPALSPVSVSDNEALRSARPGTHKREDSRVIILSGVSTTIDLGSEELLRSDSIIPAATTGSVSSTISIGSESIEADMLSSVLSGIAVTTAIGTEGIRADAIIPAATTGSVSTTVALGNETPTAAIPEAGIAITVSVGAETIRRTGWGNGGWNTDNWGHD